MKKWHITITENETGNTKLDVDTDAIIAGIDEDDGTRVIHATDCTTVTHAATISGLLDRIKEARENNPVLDFLLKVYEEENAVIAEEGQA